VEMWSTQNHSWLRVDPTEVVAPLRIELGGQVFHSLSDEDIKRGLSQEEYLLQYKSSWYFRIFGQSQLAFDLVSMRWNKFLLNFDKSGQREFFRKLGIEQIKFKHLTLFSVIALMAFFLWLNRNRYFAKTRERKELKYYTELCRLLESKGLKKEIYYGPKSYLQLGCLKWPHLAANLHDFLEVYESVSYGSQHATSEKVEQLRQLYTHIRRQLKTTSI
ncbi:MAG: DUF4129 domain-containing protein, partial [Bdellovibrionales bacterium]|nr:DUF4129 domain-containing protein [Bdellovibrionales bacterium]